MPRHHIVPQMILRRFADSREQVTLHPRTDTDHSFRLAVRKACSEVGFYTIPTDDVEESHRSDHDPEMLEEVLSDIEGAADGIIGGILAGEFPLASESRFKLAFYLALQLSRGWSFRESMTQTAQNILMLHLNASLPEDWLTETLRKEGKAATPDAIASLRRQILEDPPQLKANKSKMIQRSLDVGLHELLPHIYARHWRVLKFTDSRLLTSDNPFGYWAPPHMQKYAPFGIGNAPVVFFPLDRQTALSMTLAKTKEGVVTSGHVRAQHINYSVAVEAEKWILHHPDDAPLTGINLPPRGRFVNEYVGNRIDANGGYRELYQMIKR